VTPKVSLAMKMADYLYKCTARGCDFETYDVEAAGDHSGTRDGKCHVTKQVCPQAVIWWTGTNVKIDIICPCGKTHCVEEVYAYSVRTPCGRIFELPSQIDLIPVTITDRNVVEAK